MKKLLSLPVNMSLSEAENQIYQNFLKYVPPLSLNLMAVKVENRPDDFLGWCGELIRLCRDDLNMDLMEDEQLVPLKKLQGVLETGFTTSQFKMARIAPWPIFLGFVEQQNTLHALDERLRLLNYVDTLREQPLAELPIEDRLVFAGKHTSDHDYSVYNFDVEWFASTKGAKVFHILLEQSPEKFDAALAHIPLTGDVNDDQYQKFVEAYKAIFAEYTPDKPQSNTPPLAAATRLLAMRRPDQFIALNNNKIDIMCQGLSIAKFKNTDFTSYWNDAIGTLRTFAWWNQEEPAIVETSSKVEVETTASESDEVSAEAGVSEEKSEGSRKHAIWKNRAVLIDLFLFADVDLAANSNYVRAKDKANNASTKSKAAPKRRGKETAEMLVDKALVAEDLPEYMQGKRDTLINQVKAGKSVEQAIGLMRAIFG
ncbi:hypothetical protein ACPUVO_16855 [Pseudocolwellia sp. HL-MZ19]|uniref:hypothetical protein n=1 Tax=unclassified Pseudocolwellia TaxID=2848178 RepID=UPI003CF4773B